MPPYKAKLFWKITALASVYLVVAKLGLQLAIVYPSASPVWPGTGVALAALLVLGYEVWPGIFVGAFLTNILTAGSVATSLAIASGNTLEGLLGAFLVVRYAGGRNAFARAEDIFKFAFLAAVISTAVSAGIGTGSLYLGGFTRGLPQSRIVLTWWLGDLVGAIIITPFLVLWSARPSHDRNWRQAFPSVAAFLSVLVMGAVLFSGILPPGIRNYPLAFLCIPLLVWAAFYLRPHQAATSVIALSAIAVWGTLRGFGGFVGPDRNLSLVLLQTFMAVVSMTSLVMCAAISERKKQAISLQEAKADLESKVAERTEALGGLTARLLEIRDEEGRRIARELHDGVGQLLAAMSINAGIVERERSKLSPDTARCAEENTKLIMQVSADIRTISYLLHPPLLDELGLNSALKWYIEGFSKRSKIAATLDLPVNGERLPRDYELCLFRIAQECLTNIHRHSGATTARLRLLCSPGEIELEVSDDGKGIDYEAQSKIASGESAGVGLRGMRERVRQLGGRMDIRSNGKGSTVTATLPFKASEQSVASSTPDHRPESRTVMGNSTSLPRPARRGFLD